jgi:hypothetical protein
MMMCLWNRHVEEVSRFSSSLRLCFLGTDASLSPLFPLEVASSHLHQDLPGLHRRLRQALLQAHGRSPSSPFPNRSSYCEFACASCRAEFFELTLAFSPHRLQTLRSFELIDNKVFAAALAKWGVMKRERVAKKSAEASVAKGKQPFVPQ